MTEKTFLWLLVLLLSGRLSGMLVDACGGDHSEDDHNHQIYNHGDGHHNSNETRYLRTAHHLQDDGMDECGMQDPSAHELANDAERMRLHKVQNEKTMRVGLKGIPEVAYARLYVIPVVFHIIQPNIYTGFIPYHRVQRYVAYLNSAFAASEAPFLFELKDFTRTFNAKWATRCGDPGYETQYKRKLKQGGKETLNVYLCAAIGGSTTGFSYLPFQDSDSFVKDGVVLAERAVDDKRLNTLVHETGHWLGLLHTFGDNSCDPSSKGDLVDDTPQHISRAATINCHSDPLYWNTCPKIPGMDPVRNYMTYSYDNLCRTQFTSGQVERMVVQYEIYRNEPIAPRPEPSPPAPQPRPAPTKPTTAQPILYIISIEPPGPDCVGYFKTCKSNKDCCAGSCVNFLSAVVPGICWWQT